MCERFEPFARPKVTGSNEVLKVSFNQQDMKEESKWENRFGAIEIEAAAILKQEGANHVHGLYFASPDDATMARYVEAERVVAKRDESMGRYVESRIHGSRV